MPPVEAVITSSVRRNPRPLADALFPVIGPAIRKAIAHALSGMLDSLNRTLEQSVSVRALQVAGDGLAHGQVVCRGRAAQHAGLPRRAGVPDPLAHRAAAAARRRRCGHRAGCRHGVGHAHGDPRLRARLLRRPRRGHARAISGRRAELPDRARAPRLSGRRRARHAAARSASHPAARHRGDSPAADRRPRAVLRRRLDLRRHAAGVAGMPRVALSRERPAGLVPPLVDWRRSWCWRCWRCGAGCATWISAASIATWRRSTRNPAWSSSTPDVRAAASSSRACAIRWRPIRRRLSPPRVSRPTGSRAAGRSIRPSIPGWPCARAVAVLQPPPGVTLTMRDDTLVASGEASTSWVREASLLSRTLPGVRQLDLVGHPERGAARRQPAAGSRDGAVCPRHARPGVGPGRRRLARWSPNCVSSTSPRVRRACAFASSSPATPMPTARPTGTSR